MYIKEIYIYNTYIVYYEHVHQDSHKMHLLASWWLIVSFQGSKESNCCRLSGGWNDFRTGQVGLLKRWGHWAPTDSGADDLARVSGLSTYIIAHYDLNGFYFIVRHMIHIDSYTSTSTVCVCTFIYSIYIYIGWIMVTLRDVTEMVKWESSQGGLIHPSFTHTKHIMHKETLIEVISIDVYIYIHI